MTNRTYQIDELLNTSPCGFLSFADDGTIVMVDATLLQLLGYETDELRERKMGVADSRYESTFIGSYKTHPQAGL
ncbi:PAS domain-containing protein [Microcoleus sp. LAD1_D5]|uniref:PAS domain-containing protein n=1 Tax=unclassified Microcoleus TaxID=2642155 RepID=UPI002FD428E2